MILKFKPFFEKYEQIVTIVDTTFDKILNNYHNEVKCHIGCSDCCHALFDITLIEALYLNQYFNDKFKGEQREKLIELANKADRTVYKLKKDAFNELKSGKSEYEILRNLGNERIRCPLLNEKNQCELYERRPLTCRVYGIPTAIGGRGHTCGISGFDPGVSYPTVNMDALYGKLIDLSNEMINTLDTKNKRMGDMLIPVSMALITEFDKDYMGIE